MTSARRLGMRIVVALMTAVALLGSPTVAYAGPRTRVLGPSGPAHMASSAEVRCAFIWPDHLGSCSSLDPAVKVESQSQGDTSVCTFDGTVYWDDGSKPEKFHFNGGPDGTIFNFADHAYHKPGTYEIAVSDEVLSGPCSWRDFTVSFTYSGPPCSHETPASKRIVCIAKMILDGYAYEGWAGGS